jgi:hypothetical protein
MIEMNSGEPGSAAHRAADSGRRHRRRRPPSERGSSDLTGSTHSVVGPEGALRARDVNRPTDEDLAEAEAAVVIVRRNWRPPDAD